MGERLRREEVSGVAPPGLNLGECVVQVEVISLRDVPSAVVTLRVWTERDGVVCEWDYDMRVGSVVSLPCESLRLSAAVVRR